MTWKIRSTSRIARPGAGGSGGPSKLLGQGPISFLLEGGEWVQGGAEGLVGGVGCSGSVEDSAGMLT